MSKLKQSFLTIVIGLALIAGISYAWTGPTANPPSNNAPAPINVSAIGQYKAGALGIGGLFRAYTNAIVDGSVGIGTETPKNRLHIKGSNWPAVFVDSADAKGGFIGYGNNSKTGWATGMEDNGTWRLESYTGSGDWRTDWSSGWKPPDGNNIIVANKNGNVGVGTEFPEAKLHVKAGNEDKDPWAFRMEQGSPAAGKVLTSVDNLGNAEWREPKTSTTQTTHVSGGLYGYFRLTSTGKAWLCSATEPAYCDNTLTYCRSGYKKIFTEIDNRIGTCLKD